MNLFATDFDERLAAQSLDDVRLNKMITESCQMLVIALVKNGLPADKIPLTKAGKPYKTKGHANHPITVWTGRTRGNFRWHLVYLMEMLDEYTYRTGKTRAGEDVAMLAHDWDKLIPAGSAECFHNSSMIQNPMTIYHANVNMREYDEAVIEAYRQTMNIKWAKDTIKVKWTKREPPSWCTVKTVLIDGVHYRFTAADQSSLDQNLLGADPQS